MGLAVFFLLALIVTGIVAYPLLPGRTTARPQPVVTDGDIERAVRDLRRTRSGSGQFCPTCGKAHQVEDRFCVRCGSALPGVAGAGPVCPSCGAAVREADQFCAKCGHGLAAGEAA